MSEYKPTYTTEVRGNKEDIAPFFSMPDGTEWNVWNISKEHYTAEIEAAIKNAFKLGWRAAGMKIQKDLTQIEVE